MPHRLRHAEPQDDGLARLAVSHFSAPTRFFQTPAASRRAAHRLLASAPREVDWNPTFEGLERLARGLNVGDPIADDLAACMRREGHQRVWALFERALSEGIEHVRGAPSELRAFFDVVGSRPAWVDAEAVERGAEVAALGGRAGMNALLVNGLMAGYQFSAINKTLLATGELDTSASRRIAYTTRWWYAVTRRDRLDRFDEGFKATIRVRMIHALVRERLLRGEAWPLEELGVPVCQTDMQATYLGFSSVYILGLRMMGVPVSEAEEAALMHRWRYIAWINGVQEEYLHDLDDEVLSGFVNLYQNTMTQRHSDETSGQLARPLIDEPLERTYRYAGGVLGRYNRAVLLSIAGVSIGRGELKGMGITDAQPPWYPLVVHVGNQVMHRIARVLPWGRDALTQVGRWRQRRVLDEVGHDGSKHAA